MYIMIHTFIMEYLYIEWIIKFHDGSIPMENIWNQYLS